AVKNVLHAATEATPAEELAEVPANQEVAASAASDEPTAVKTLIKELNIKRVSAAQAAASKTSMSQAIEVDDNMSVPPPPPPPGAGAASEGTQVWEDPYDP